MISNNRQTFKLFLDDVQVSTLYFFDLWQRNSFPETPPASACAAALLEERPLLNLADQVIYLLKHAGVARRAS